MSGMLDTNCGVYYCLVCGPCIVLLDERGEITVHNQVPHPDEVPMLEDDATLQ